MTTNVFVRPGRAGSTESRSPLVLGAPTGAVAGVLLQAPAVRRMAAGG